MLNERLHELGSYFGALPVHNGMIGVFPAFSDHFYPREFLAFYTNH